MSGSLVPIQPMAFGRLDVNTILQNLEDALHRAGVQRDDPARPLFDAIAQAIRFVDERTGISDRVLKDATERIAAALRAANETATTEAERLRTELAATEAHTIRRLGDRIADNAETALNARVKLLRWEIVLAAVFLFGGGLFGSYFLGDWFGADRGRTQAEASIQETETHLQAAFRYGGKSAEIWRELMENNDIAMALASCAERNTIFFDNNRRACGVPLWLAPPPPMPPFKPTAMIMQPGQ
jgi:signal transduction histidine kinase